MRLDSLDSLHEKKGERKIEVFLLDLIWGSLENRKDSGFSVLFEKVEMGSPHFSLESKIYRILASGPPAMKDFLKWGSCRYETFAGFKLFS